MAARLQTRERRRPVWETQTAGLSIPGLHRCLQRLFLPALFAIAWIAPLLLVGLPWASTQAMAPEIRGVWVTTNDTEVVIDRSRMQAAVEQLARLNFNTIYPVVWNSGYALYPSDVAEQAGIQPFKPVGLQQQDTIAELIDYAHQRGLKAMPWFEFGFMAPPTSELAMNHEDWLTRKRNGELTSVSAAGEVVWLNPFDPEVQQFLTNLVLEVVDRYDIDGIQFDDHLSLPREFGYDPVTIARYTQETKKAPPADAKDPAWVRWRANKISEFVKQLHEAVKARKPDAIFSVAPNYYDFAYNLHLQDWLNWVRQGLVDELVVQVYRDDLESFVQEINRPEIREAQQRIPTGIGILTGLRRRPVEMERIVRQSLATRDRSLGIVYFFYESLWDYSPDTASQRQAALQALFPVAVPRPIPTPPVTPPVTPPGTLLVTPPGIPTASPVPNPALSPPES